MMRSFHWIISNYYWKNLATSEYNFKLLSYTLFPILFPRNCNPRTPLWLCFSNDHRNLDRFWTYCKYFQHSLCLQNKWLHFPFPLLFTIRQGVVADLTIVWMEPVHSPLKCFLTCKNCTSAREKFLDNISMVDSL